MLQATSVGHSHRERAIDLLFLLPMLAILIAKRGLLAKQPQDYGQ